MDKVIGPYLLAIKYVSTGKGKSEHYSTLKTTEQEISNLKQWDIVRMYLKYDMATNSISQKNKN